MDASVKRQISLEPTQKPGFDTGYAYSTDGFLADIIKESRLSIQSEPGGGLFEYRQVVAHATAAMVIERVIHDKLPRRFWIGHLRVKMRSDSRSAFAYLAV